MDLISKILWRHQMYKWIQYQKQIWNWPDQAINLFIFSHWNVHNAEWSSIHKCLTKWLNHIKKKKPTCSLWWESFILSCLEEVKHSFRDLFSHKSHTTIVPSNIFPSNMLLSHRSVSRYRRKMGCECRYMLLKFKVVCVIHMYQIDSNALKS